MNARAMILTPLEVYCGTQMFHFYFQKFQLFLTILFRVNHTGESLQTSVLIKI